MLIAAFGECAQVVTEQRKDTISVHGLEYSCLRVRHLSRQIAENAAGGLDLDDLDRNLKAYSRRRLKIGKYARETASNNLSLAELVW